MGAKALRAMPAAIAAATALRDGARARDGGPLAAGASRHSGDAGIASTAPSRRRAAHRGFHSGSRPRGPESSRPDLRSRRKPAFRCGWGQDPLLPRGVRAFRTCRARPPVPGRAGIRRRVAAPRAMPRHRSGFATLRRRPLENPPRTRSGGGARAVEQAARVCIRFAPSRPDAASVRLPAGRPAASGPRSPGRRAPAALALSAPTSKISCPDVLVGRRTATLAPSKRRMRMPSFRGIEPTAGRPGPPRTVPGR